MNGGPYVVEYFEGNVVEVVVENGEATIAPIAGEDATPPEPAANDNSTGDDAA